jgi:hypothetical protein
MMHDSSQHLSYCSFSKYCMHFLDELDTLYFLPQKGLFISSEQAPYLDDPQLLEQLRAHLPTCSICTAAVTHARRISVRQRSLLRKMLGENERVVPSTSARIMKAVRLNPR